LRLNEVNRAEPNSPLFRGSMRNPARHNLGRANSTIGG
jgi:hypothetical protein